MVWFIPALSKVVTILPIAAKILKPFVKKAITITTPVIKKVLGKTAAKSSTALVVGKTTVASTISKAGGTKAAKVLTGLYIGSTISGDSTSRKTAGVLTATAFGGPTAGMGVAISTMFNRKSEDTPPNANVDSSPLNTSVKKLKNVGTGGVSILPTTPNSGIGNPLGYALSAMAAGLATVPEEKFKIPESMTPVVDPTEEKPRKTITNILSENVKKAQEFADQKISGLTDNPTARDILLATTAATGGFLLGRLGEGKETSTPKKKKKSTTTKKKASSSKKTTKKSSSKAKGGRKLKFGSPAWRAKYMGKKRQGKKGKSVSVASIKRKGIPGPDRIKLGTEAQYKKKGGKKVYHTKTGQPYIKMKSGKARFIKKS